MRWLVFTLTLFFISSAHAKNPGLDYRAGAGVRSYPLGAAAWAEAGYGIPLWGEWQTEDSPWYGYLRPVLGLTSAATINEGVAALRFHPVSFLGIVAGRGHSIRSRDTSFIVDCHRYMCDGTLRYDFLLVETALAFGDFILVSELDGRDYLPSGDGEEFYEDGFALLGRRGGDRSFSNTLTVAKKVEAASFEHLTVGLAGRRVEFHRSGQASERLSLIARHGPRHLKFSYAAGVYKSDLNTSSLALGVSVTWIPETGLTLD